ncbi:Rieske (2Fe-2S) protein, partial [Falsiroseomonas sp. HW251]|uniref:Rieske (2Fe-2S) protein n=1 Tax=Falsiroseomonas sp. HW251 TaxID=3390998 RepID=UPI003D31548A
MALHPVARSDEIPPGGRKIVTLEGRSVGVFNIDGEFFAIRNSCPHEGAPLCEGVVSGLAKAREPGVIEYDRAGEIIRCPWHAWEFDIRTGRSHFDPDRVRVRAYPARTVDAAAIQAGAACDRAREGAETYPAFVEGEYVVID